MPEDVQCIRCRVTSQPISSPSAVHQGRRWAMIYVFCSCYAGRRRPQLQELFRPVCFVPATPCQSHHARGGPPGSFAAWCWQQARCRATVASERMSSSESCRRPPHRKQHLRWSIAKTPLCRPSPQVGADPVPADPERHREERVQQLHQARVRAQVEEAPEPAPRAAARSGPSGPPPPRCPSLSAADSGRRPSCCCPGVERRPRAPGPWRRLVPNCSHRSAA